MTDSSVDINSVNNFKEHIMFYVGIDVAKDKHDCIIVDSDGKITVPSFTIPNTLSGFQLLYDKITSSTSDFSAIKIGLEATGHYSNHIIEFLGNHQFETFVVNPLHTCLYRKSLSFRKTKTDKIDATLITDLLRTETLKPYCPASDDIKELKILTRYRFSLIQDCSRLKVSTTRLINILFPELDTFMTDLNGNSAHALLSEYPGAFFVASSHLTKLSNLLHKSSKGHIHKETCVALREAARNSVGVYNPIHALELQQTIARIKLIQTQTEEVEALIRNIIDRLHPQILTIPGISYTLAAIILAEIDDFSKFSSAEKVLAFAGLEPSVYQSGQYLSTHAKMVKRGSIYLRYALFTAAKCVCNFDSTFHEYLSKKRAEGKPYNVAMSHVAKKLTRVIYCLETQSIPYKK